MASRELKNTDAGAPQLTGNTVGSLISVLKAALVTGYGETQSLGWEVFYEDLVKNVCVFRPKVGTRMFLQVTDDGTFSNGRNARVVSYETMTNAYHGTHPCPVDVNYQYIRKTDVTSNVAQNWRIIGDEKGFYLLTFPWTSHSTALVRNNSIPYYFGEGIVFGDVAFTTGFNWLHWSGGNNAQVTTKYYWGMVSIMRDPVTQYINNKNFIYSTYNTPAGGMRSILHSGTNEEVSSNTGKRCNTSFAGSRGYTPVHMNFDPCKCFEVNIPGLFEPALPQLSFNYRPGEIWYEDINETNKIITFPTRAFGSSDNLTNAGAQLIRLSILIGDKFRYVF